MITQYCKSDRCVYVLFIGNNPQYSLKVRCGDPLATVWVLLSRHITTKVRMSITTYFLATLLNEYVCCLNYRVILPTMRNSSHWILILVMGSGYIITVSGWFVNNSSLAYPITFLKNLFVFRKVSCSRGENQYSSLLSEDRRHHQGNIYLYGYSLTAGIPQHNTL